jgi:dihydrofolate synthase/folylpolyglutamate synthase
LRDEINLLRATFFEVTTAIAFKYFADEKVDFAVVEVGLGGRLDSTNVIKPAVSVITTVSFDHMDVLGEAIEQIAFEKAGIIKEGVPSVTGCEDEKALDVIKKVANEKKSELVVLDEVAKFELKEIDEKSVKYDLKTRSNFYSDLVAGVGGSFQVRNSSLSVLAYEKLCDLGLAKFKSDFVYDGLLNVVKFSGLRGRLEILKEKPKVVADVAHNYPAICQLVSELGNFKRKRTLVLFGVMKDKEYEKMIKKLSEVVDFAVATQPKIGRALNCKTIAEIFKRNNVEAIEISDSDKAYDFILDEAGEDDLILVTGSHYLVGEVIAHIERRKIEILI